MRVLIGDLCKALKYFPETGKLTWIVSPSMRAPAGTEAGSIDPRGYRIIRYRGCAMWAHRLAWALHHGDWPVGEIDHINGLRDDNRIANLRVVSRRENLRNTGTPRSNTSGVVGVSFNANAGKWRAYIKVDGRQKHLGLYELFDEAVAVRKAAERECGFHENHGRRL